MAKIRSSSANVGVTINENGTATYGADPGAWASALRVPFTSCDIKAQDEILPESGEFTSLGGAQQPIRGRRFARGSITVEPVYDGAWFWLLFGHGFGTEDLATGTDIEEGVETGMNTHVFDISAGVTQTCDLALRVYKNSWMETYKGLTCTRWVWEHTSGQIPTLTMDWAGIADADPTATVADFVATLPTDNRVKLTDLGRTDSDVKIGNTQAEHNVTTIRIIGERSVDLDDPEFLQSLLVTSRPGQQENRAISIELEGTLETTTDTPDKIMTEYFADTLSKASIGYASSVTATGIKPYRFRFDFPKVSWTAFAGDLNQLGLIPWTATGLCQVGATTGLTPPFDSYDGTPAYPSGAQTDCRLLVQVDDGDDVDAKYTTLANS